MEPTTEAILDAIKADRSSGAAQLSIRAVEALAHACSDLADQPLEKALSRIAALVRRIRDLRPSMAAPGNWALIFFTDIKEHIHSDSSESLPNMGADIRAALLKRMDENHRRMEEAAKPLLREAGCIMTLSYSSTIEGVIRRAAPRGATVIVAESRPLLEGREMLRRLKEAGREVRCITDAEIGLFMQDAAILLLGADTIGADLAAINKTGSYPAALSAQDRETPCAIFADTFKINGLRSSSEIPLEEGPGGEVWANESALCANIYFEPVPARLITCFVTEKGVLAHQRIREESARWKRLWEGLEALRSPDFSGS